MTKCKSLLIFALIPIILMTGCVWERKYVNTNAVKTLRKDLLAYSSSVKSVKVSFFRPGVTIDVRWAGPGDAASASAVLGKVRDFTTMDNMNEIAGIAGWDMEIRDVALYIQTDDTRYIYEARYFKTANASDRSEANIDAYRSWSGGEYK